MASESKHLGDINGHNGPTGLRLRHGYFTSDHWRDARLTKIFEGTSEIQQRIISDNLLDKAPPNERSGMSMILRNLGTRKY
jgi:hypothetical protein